MGPLVHLELQTPNAACACAYYRRLFGWPAESVRYGAATYLALDLATGLTGGVAEGEIDRAFWLPYVEVPLLPEAVAAAESAGARVALDPREGPAGWRSIVSTPAGGPVALWQRKPGYRRR